MPETLRNLTTRSAARALPQLAAAISIGVAALTAGVLEGCGGGDVGVTVTCPSDGAPCSDSGREAETEGGGGGGDGDSKPDVSDAGIDTVTGETIVGEAGGDGAVSDTGGAADAATPDSDAIALDTATETGAAEIGASDTGAADTADAGVTDTGDATVDVDTGAADTGAADTGATDTGDASADAAVADTTDTGATEIGATDTGATGTTDTGATDTGATDTGATDTGATDTGSVASLPPGQKISLFYVKPLMDVAKQPGYTYTIFGTGVKLPNPYTNGDVIKTTGVESSIAIAIGAQGGSFTVGIDITGLTAYMVDPDIALATSDGKKVFPDSQAACKSGEGARYILLSTVGASTLDAKALPTGWTFVAGPFKAPKTLPGASDKCRVLVVVAAGK